MPLQNFIDKVGPTVSALWLNAVDTLKFTIFGDAATKAAARTNLTSDLPLEIANGGTAARTAAAARTSLTTDAPLEITNGGTGARSLGAFVTSMQTAGLLSQLMNTQNGATYLIAATDVGNSVAHTDNLNATIYSLPQDSAAAIAIGGVVSILNISTNGNITIQAGTGATIAYYGSSFATGLGYWRLPSYTQTSFKKVAANSWQQIDPNPARNEETFTATLTGMTVATTGSVNITRFGTFVLMHIPVAITGTSNTTAMTLSGIPPQYMPPNNATVFAPTLVLDNGIAKGAWAAIDFAVPPGTTGSIAYGLGFDNAGGFTAAGTKGLAAGTITIWTTI